MSLLELLIFWTEKMRKLVCQFGIILHRIGFCPVFNCTDSVAKTTHNSGKDSIKKLGEMFFSQNVSVFKLDGTWMDIYEDNKKNTSLLKTGKSMSRIQIYPWKL